jgi:hypothetical protein
MLKRGIAFARFAIAAMLVTFGVSAGMSAMAQISAGASKEAPKANAKKKSTDVSFDDVLVQGKYHFADEAVTTVEDDKVLDALLGVRTDFKDRVKKSTARH